VVADITGVRPQAGGRERRSLLEAADGRCPLVRRGCRGIFTSTRRRARQERSGSACSGAVGADSPLELDGNDGRQEGTSS
jgi:hypothetical protein